VACRGRCDVDATVGDQATKRAATGSPRVQRIAGDPVRIRGGVTLAGMLALLDADQLAALVDRRHAWGVDVIDEVWEGVRHHPPVGPHSALNRRSRSPSETALRSAA
jgi:hypothetical protein